MNLYVIQRWAASWLYNITWGRGVSKIDNFSINNIRMASYSAVI